MKDPTCELTSTATEMPPMIEKILEAELALKAAIADAMKLDPVLLGDWSDVDTGEEISQSSDRSNWYPEPVVIQWTIRKELFSKTMEDEQ